MIYRKLCWHIRNIFYYVIYRKLCWHIRNIFYYVIYRKLCWHIRNIFYYVIYRKLCWHIRNIFYYVIYRKLCWHIRNIFYYVIYRKLCWHIRNIFYYVIYRKLCWHIRNIFYYVIYRKLCWHISVFPGTTTEAQEILFILYLHTIAPHNVSYAICDKMSGPVKKIGAPPTGLPMKKVLVKKMPVGATLVKKIHPSKSTDGNAVAAGNSSSTDWSNQRAPEVPIKVKKIVKSLPPGAKIISKIPPGAKKSAVTKTAAKSTATPSAVTLPKPNDDGDSGAGSHQSQSQDDVTASRTIFSDPTLDHYIRKPDALPVTIIDAQTPSQERSRAKLLLADIPLVPDAIMNPSTLSSETKSELVARRTTLSKLETERLKCKAAAQVKNPDSVATAAEDADDPQATSAGRFAQSTAIVTQHTKIKDAMEVRKVKRYKVFSCWSPVLCYAHCLSH